jgi:hypothetical protein
MDAIAQFGRQRVVRSIRNIYSMETMRRIFP